MLFAWFTSSRVILVLAGCACLAVNGAPTAPAAPSNRALILHDSSGAAGWIGGLHARLLANLLGHFELDYRIQPVESYASGDVQAHHTTFYLGTTFSNALPADFIDDILQTDRTVCWFKYNLWEAVDGETNRFTDRFGFRFHFMDQSGFDTVEYRGETFAKNPLDPELGRSELINPGLAAVRATARRSSDSHSMPYAIQGSNLWYVADSPFSFTDEEDRYLVFCDLLHDILQIDHPAAHRAIIRLEDIDPNYPTNLLYRTTDLLAAEGVPFAVAVIPVHEDPFGLYNGNVPRRLPLTDKPDFARALQYAMGRGGQIALHGYTHQYRSMPNPFSALSGDDYEFYRVTVDAQTNVVTFRPVPEDSVSWVQSRLDAARLQLAQAGLSAVAWVTPHYAASPLDYRVFATNFPLTIQRVLYSDEDGHTTGQFFPYVIHRDIYGQCVLPENLGNVHPGGWLHFTPRSVDDLLRAARKNRAVRDGWASAFFHPFLDPEDLRRLVRGIRDLGYTFVPLTTNAPPVITHQPIREHHWPGDPVTIRITANGAAPISYQWRFNGVDLPGETNDVLALEALHATGLGSYTVRVSNGAGSTVSLPIGARFLATPTIQSYALTDGVFRIRFEGATGLHYHADYRDYFNATSWTATFPVIGHGGLTNINAPVGGLGKRFYRLRVD